MLDIIFLKSIILVGCALNLVIPLIGMAYKVYRDEKTGEFIMLTTGDLGAIKTALEQQFSETADEPIIIVGGDFPLDRY